MKKILTSFFAIFLIAGCAQKSSVVNLDPYQSFSSRAVNNVNVYLVSVNDSRSNKSVLGTILDSDSNVKDSVSLGNDLSSWFKQSLVNELNAIGANVVENSDNALIVNVDIQTLEASINGYTGDNLKAKGEVFITIKKGNKTFTKRVADTESKFVAIRDNDAFKPIIKSVLDSLITKSAKQIVTNLWNA